MLKYFMIAMFCFVVAKTGGADRSLRQPDGLQPGSHSLMRCLLMCMIG